MGVGTSRADTISTAQVDSKVKGSLVAVVEDAPAVQGTRVPSVIQKDP